MRKREFLAALVVSGLAWSGFRQAEDQSINTQLVDGRNTRAACNPVPPSITEPGWEKDSNHDCYQSRLVHTQHGPRLGRVWVCG
jgi:hypothetical protein